MLNAETVTDRLDLGWAVLVLGDWREHAEEIRAAVPDAVITDPPYGIGQSRMGEGRANRTMALRAADAHQLERGSPPLVGDETGPSREDIDIMVSLAPQSIVWGADHLRDRLPSGGRYLAWNKLGWKLQSYDSFCDVEFAWHSRRGAARVWNQVWKGACSGGASNADSRRWHPTQKSIQVMEWCIEQARLPASAVVCDPYMGAATTAIACYRRGLRFIGFEIDRKWFEASCKRIAEMAPSLPLLAACEPEQASLL